MRNLLCALGIILILSAKACSLSPQEIVAQLDKNFSKIRDAQADITFDAGLEIIGCGGMQRYQGKLWYKAPNKIKVDLDKTLYFFRGNQIRKIDPHGKKYYVTLLHAPDFTPGFNPKLISHNFNLKITKETSQEIILEGIPKPGVLKNVKQIYFYIDPKNFLLRKMIYNLRQNLKGYTFIKYENFGNINVPTAAYGKTALEFNSGSLVGFKFNLSGTNLKINAGLSDKIFDPGF